MKLKSLRRGWLGMLFAALLVGCGGGGGGDASPAPSATGTGTGICTWDSSTWNSGCTWG